MNQIHDFIECGGYMINLALVTYCDQGQIVLTIHFASGDVLSLEGDDRTQFITIMAGETAND